MTRLPARIPFAGPTIVCLALTSLACVETHERIPTYTVRDSSGVKVVESAEPLWTPREAWKVASEPTTVIGTVYGGGPDSFYQVAGVSVLPGGRILVVNSGTSEVRLFTSEGEFETSFGGEGQGPGEFMWISDGGRYRTDSLWVYDYNLYRVSVFGPDGTFARQVRNPVPAHLNYWIRGAFADGAFGLHGPGVSRMEGPPGLREDSSAVLALSRDGLQIDTLQWSSITLKEVGARGRASRVRLAPYAWIQIANDRVYLSEGKEAGFRVVERDGTTSLVTRRAFSLQAVTEEIVDAYLDDYVAFLTRGREGNADAEGIRSSLAEDTFAETMPAASELLVDLSGHVWLSRHHFVGVSAHTWDIFDPEGRWLGTVSTPPDMETKAIGAGFVVGLYRDELDVEYVRVYELLQGER